jgi:long-chain fatty acid transport protein
VKPRFAGSICLIALIMISQPYLAGGNGFDIYEQGAKAVAMGGAFTAQADDPSAIFFNPAGITQLSGTQVSLGITPIMPSTTFQSDGNPLMGSLPGSRTEVKDHTWWIPNGYITHKISDKISLGLGSFAHFGLGVEWPEDFEGRFTPGSVRTVLTTISLSPVIAFKPWERLSLAAGPYLQYMDIDMRNMAFIAPPVPPFTGNRNLAQTVEARLKADDWDWGFNLGGLLWITENLRFGVSYLSQVHHTFTDGTQELTRLSDGALIQKQGASSSITLPATLRMGLAWKLNRWTLEADGQWTDWSCYRQLRVNFSDGTTTEVQKDWHDSWAWRFGLQYSVNAYLDLRGGFALDDSPIPADTLDPLIPSGMRKFYCLGLGIHLGPFTLDAAYNYVQDQDRRWNNSAGDVKLGPVPLTRVTGQFEQTYAHLFSVSLTYRF